MSLEVTIADNLGIYVELLDLAGRSTARDPAQLYWHNNETPDPLNQVSTRRTGTQSETLGFALRTRCTGDRHVGRHREQLRKALPQ